MAEKERRVFAGYYKRYDGKHIFVVTTAKDYASQEEPVIFYTVDYKDKNQYVTMPLKDFNAKVKHNGKTVRCFTRQTQMNAPNWLWLDIEEDGFEGVRRTNKPKEHKESYYSRRFRTATTYYDYAKDLCKHYTEDRDRHLLCKAHNRYIGISKDEYAVMMEDYRFINGCLKSVMKVFAEYFTERYINGVSVRKYADQHDLNRGSVEHIERKMMDTLAAELKRRDEADGVCRLKTKTE